MILGGDAFSKKFANHYHMVRTYFALLQFLPSASNFARYSSNESRIKQSCLKFGRSGETIGSENRGGSMKYRIAIWAVAGFIVASGWALYFLVAS